jgi:hypothetical protein
MRTMIVSRNAKPAQIRKKFGACIFVSPSSSARIAVPDTGHFGCLTLHT